LVHLTTFGALQVRHTRLFVALFSHIILLEDYIKPSLKQLQERVSFLENELAQLRKTTQEGESGDITGHEAGIDERRLFQKENETISRISNLFLSSKDMSDIYEQIPAILKEQFDYPITGIIEYDRVSDEIVFLGSAGVPAIGSGNPRFPADQTMAGTVIKTGKGIVEFNAAARSDYSNPILRSLDVKTFICEPIFVREKTTGALIMADGHARKDASRIARTMRIIADYLSQEISRKLAEQGLEWQLAVNMALAGLSGSIISQSNSLSDIAVITMEFAKLLTDSDLGFASEINTFTGSIVIHAATKSQEEGRQAEKKSNSSITSVPDAALWGHAPHTNQPFYTNTPHSKEAWPSFPGGGHAITRLLSVPVLFDNVVVGQIALANAPRDYTDNDLVVVRRLGSLYAMAINLMRSENRLKESLNEKEVLIKELHHRVKNNLQVVSSLIALQSRKVDDEKYRVYFEESMNRIQAIALVHEKLYNSKDMTKIDFANYLNDLTRYLFYTYNINRQLVLLHLNVGDISLGIDTAVPCAMIINELVSNSLKHGFPDGREGEITVSLNINDEGKHALMVRDTGIGVPPGFDLQSSGSLGIQIVLSLIKQIRGKIEIGGNGGLSITIIF
jgi:two-component sensor histidine kinase